MANLNFLHGISSEPCFGLSAVDYSKSLTPNFEPRHLVFKGGRVGQTDDCDLVIITQNLLFLEHNKIENENDRF